MITIVPADSQPLTLEMMFPLGQSCLKNQSFQTKNQRLISGRKGRRNGSCDERRVGLAEVQALGQ